MSTIREAYEKINIKFRSHKENLHNCLLIEIYDSQDEQDFFIKELESITKKLFEKMQSEDINNDCSVLNKKNFFRMFFTIFMLFI
jgi:hypothetical protein